MRTQDIARVCHEANRAYCETLEDGSQVPWDSAPAWQRESSIEGVQKNLDAGPGGISPEEHHKSWMESKLRHGWMWGPAKDPTAKLHPCLVEYSDLPEDQKRKDALFAAIVEALR